MNLVVEAAGKVDTGDRLNLANHFLPEVEASGMWWTRSDLQLLVES